MDASPTPTVVVALGGHAFVQPGERGTPEQTSRNAAAICAALMVFVERGYNLILTHGNGPQVGDLLDQAELARAEVPEPPLDVLVAQTEGSLGYLLQRALLNQLRARGIRRYVVTMITQVLVDPADPAFAAPSKPVGPGMHEAEARRREAELGWQVVRDGQRGWRRVVASPRPIQVGQRHMIREASEAGHIVIAAGGGGVPTAKDPATGDYVGVEAVIDKDWTSSLLASEVGAELLVILTAVDGAYVGWGTPAQRRLEKVTVAECQRHLDAGEFPPGSMRPKIEAVVEFLQRGGRRAVITDAAHLGEALDGTAGTAVLGPYQPQAPEP